MLQADLCIPGMLVLGGNLSQSDQTGTHFS